LNILQKTTYLLWIPGGFKRAFAPRDSSTTFKILQKTGYVFEVSGGFVQASTPRRLPIILQNPAANSLSSTRFLWIPKGP
jgi:hypothetical protein